jgi:hypothetical protein
MCEFYNCDNEPNILFFKGVIPEDYDIETLFTNKILEQLNINEFEEEYELRTNDKIPPLFIDMVQWPKTLQILCWWCHRRFNSVPVFIPLSIVDNGNIVPHGCFCSFQCAAAHIDIFSERKIRWEQHSMLKMLHLRMTGSTIDYIYRAPHPFNMIQYGKQSMTGDQYSELLKTLK